MPGGSSGGSAASVAACQCAGALGTDTGGSIRQPASLCGCVGLKPTYGRVSRYGLLAYASSFDQIGPMTRSVEDAALMLGVIAGYDERDSTCLDAPVPDYAAALAGADLRGVKLGLPREFFGHEALEPGVRKACGEAVDCARSLGAELVEVSLPHTEYAVAAYYVMASAEAGSNLARYDGVRYGHRTENPPTLEELYVRSRTEGFGEEVQRRILVGAYVLSSGYYDAYYRKAAQVRRLIRRDYDEALARCDALLAPVSPVTAWKLGEVHEPLQMYLMVSFTLSLNPGRPAGAGSAGGVQRRASCGKQLMGQRPGRGYAAAHRQESGRSSRNRRAGGSAVISGADLPCNGEACSSPVLGTWEAGRQISSNAKRSSGDGVRSGCRRGGQLKL